MQTLDVESSGGHPPSTRFNGRLLSAARIVGDRPTPAADLRLRPLQCAAGILSDAQVMETFRRSSTVGSRKSTASEATAPSLPAKNPIRSALTAIRTCFSFPPEKTKTAAKTPPLGQPTPPARRIRVRVGVNNCLSTAETSRSSGRSETRLSQRPKFQSSSTTEGRGRSRSSGRSETRLSRRAKFQSSGTTESIGRSFSMAEIRAAARNFSPSCKIGQGGFGTVYKGTLADGTVVAIKRAKKNFQDKQLGVEFKRETEILAGIEHLNLVRLYGYLEHEDEKLVVLEYVSNGTLRQHLDCMMSNQALDMAARLDIAIDVAHAVTYLHMYADEPIIHRDIKSSNILLTESLRAKVADFGFARVAPVDADVTHVSTQVKGTAGYLDPEYLRTYQLTEKSDVYSFGVLLVELVSGRRPIEIRREMGERVTAVWAMKMVKKGRAMETLDPNLAVTAAAEYVVEKMFELAEKCLAPTRHGRPTMRRCAELLWAIRKDYRSLAAAEAPFPFSRAPWT